MMMNKKEQRIGETKYNNQNCFMEIIKYINHDDIVVRFQDKYMAEVHSKYSHFLSGKIKNPYYPSVYGVGMIGIKYLSKTNGVQAKEYITWQQMLRRCFDKKTKERYHTYKNVTCCDEWLLYENFYEWLHGQENFDKWFNSYKWDLDKDIVVKGNKIYSPENCCLVPQNVNKLFEKRYNNRSSLPIGVGLNKNKYRAYCNNPYTNKYEHLGHYSTPEEAFQAYKQAKEFYIKQVAQEEYNKGNITKKCYEAMMNYEVEITD